MFGRLVRNRAVTDTLNSYSQSISCTLIGRCERYPRCSLAELKKDMGNPGTRADNARPLYLCTWGGLGRHRLPSPFTGARVLYCTPLNRPNLSRISEIMNGRSFGGLVRARDTSRSYATAPTGSARLWWPCSSAWDSSASAALIPLEQRRVDLEKKVLEPHKFHIFTFGRLN